MRLSKKTIDIIKSFANINGNLLIKPGNTISTISVARNIFSFADVSEEFDTEFGIYNTHEFLGAISLFREPFLEFNDKFVRIREESGSGMSLKYVGASKDILVFPTKPFKSPPFDIEFDISQEDFMSVIKGASVISSPDLQIISNSSGINIKVCDRKNPSSNDFVLPVSSSTTDTEMSFNLKVENLKLMPGNFTVKASSKGVAVFENPSMSVTTVIALEAN